MANDWNPDERYLSFLEHKLVEKGESLDEPLVGIGSEVYTNRHFLETMRKGTDLGRELYKELHDEHQEEFKEYLVSLKNTAPLE